jgi:hypothetical protein
VVPRPGDPLDDRAAEIRASFGQEIDPVGQRFLLFRVEAGPPLFELVGELDFPQATSMSIDYL